MVSASDHETLNQQRLIQTLIEVGWITPDRLAAGLCVIAISRRATIWIVRATDGPSLVVKHATDATVQLRLAREAAVYRHLRSMERDCGPFLPAAINHDAGRGLLIVDYIDGPSMADAVPHAALEPAGALGRTLAHLHLSGHRSLDPELAVTTRPWVLQVHRPSLGWYTHSSQASLMMRAMIQQHAPLVQALDDLHDAWAADSLIHADLKLEHVIAGNRAGRDPMLPAIIDWESAQLGDAAWDIGSIFAGYLLRWLRSIPVIDDRPFAETADLAAVPLAQVQQPVAAFWEAYRHQSALEPAAQRDLVLRATRYAAAVMIQREDEYLQTHPAPTDWTSLILQISANMLADPLAGATVLLGLDTRSGDAA
jgi:aminoglycoside phosphotransferase (APT) family kinase protein